MLATIERFQFDFSDDVYIMRRRASFPELMLNRGYDGIQVMNFRDRRVVTTINFPHSVGDFPIETWLITPDGVRSYLFSRDRSEVVVAVNHLVGRCEVVMAPKNLEAPTGLCWFTPELHIRDYYGRNWRLHGQTFREAREDSLPNSVKHLLRIEDRARSLGVLRMCYDQLGMYVMSDSKIGYLSLDGRYEYITDRDKGDIDLALVNNSLLICSPRHVRVVRDNEQSIFLSARADEGFACIEEYSLDGTKYVSVLAVREDANGSRLYISSI